MKYVLLAGLVSAGILAAQTTGSIEGQVLNAATGAPVKKATLRLSGSTASGPARATGARRTAVNLIAETDAAGKYQFLGLPEGRYTITAQKPGFVGQSYGARRPGGLGETIELAGNQHMNDATIKLLPQAVISGRVLDEDGDPIPSAAVSLYRQSYVKGKKVWTQAGGSSTSDQGEYRASNLTSGRYLVSASYRGPLINNRFGPEPNQSERPDMIYAPTYYPNTVSQPNASEVAVGAGGEVRGIDIRMSKVAAYRIRGTVSGIVGGRGPVNVMLFPTEGSGLFNAGSTADAGTNQFEIRGVIPGQYTMAVRYGGPQELLTANQPLTVGAGNVDGVVVTVSPPFEFSGQVSIAERGTSVSVKNVRVTLSPMGTFFGNGQLSVTADAEGRFTFKGIAPGTYGIDVQSLPDNCFVQVLKYGGRTVQQDGAEINGPAPIEVVLSTTAAKIGGSAIDKDGKPVSAATVVLLSESAVMASTTTDYSGAFSFARLRPGTYRLIAWEDVESGAWQDPEFRKPYEGRATEVKVGPNEQQSAQLKVIAADEMTGR